MFVLAYYNEKKEIVSSKIGQFADLRAEVEECFTKGSQYSTAVISKIEGRRFVLPKVQEEPKEPKKSKNG